MANHALVSLVFALLPFHCVAQCDTCTQKVLLIGTLHRTSPGRVKEVVQIAEAIKRFDPAIICVEYPVPTDTPAIMLRGGSQAFKDTEKNRKAWNVSPEHALAITSLRNHLREHPLDRKKRMELQQHYYLSHDLGNAHYQGYLIFSQVDRYSEAEAALKNAFASYETLRSPYERGQGLNNEYNILVFPLAKVLNISYLYPIDDQSNWNSIQEYYDRLQSKDVNDSIKIRYQERTDTFKEMMRSFPMETNQYLYVNSPSFVQDMLATQGYIIGADSVHEDLKMQHSYWVLRNRKMAEYIDQVVCGHPNENIVVFFGAAHIGPVSEELKNLNRGYHVVSLPDILE